MNICVIGPKDSKESLMLKTLAESAGHVCKRIYMPDVYFEIKNSVFTAQHRKLELLDFDVFLFRPVTKFLNEAQMLAEYLHSVGKVVIDANLATERHTPLRNNYLLSQAGIPQLNLSQTMSLKAGRDVLMEIEHPILVVQNGAEGKKEMNISEDWTDSYDVVRTSKHRNFAFYQYINARNYSRIFVIGGKVIGGLHKEIMEEEPKLNHSKWARNRKLEVTPELSEMARRSSEAVKYEICAVDILSTEQGLFVLGVHRAPKFTLFQRISGVDFTQKLLDDVIERGGQVSHELI